MARLMYEAVVLMGAAKSSRASLLPSGQSLDLFVTLTDYYGYQQLVQIHDPPLIYERDHHHILHFTYRRHSNGEVESDCGLDNAPGLGFAVGTHRRKRRGRPTEERELAAREGIYRY